jgi:intraflagellar transport protein 81
VTELKSEALSQEQRYHLLTCQLSSVDHTIRRLTSGPAADRLRDRLALRVSEAEEAARGLREQQREIKDNATTGASQIDMMNDLLRLLQVRAGVKCACAESSGAAWTCVLDFCCFVRKCP